MKLEGFQLSAIDWREAKSSEVRGATGTATMRAHQLGLAQLRIVEYGAGYLADHWCDGVHRGLSNGGKRR